MPKQAYLTIDDSPSPYTDQLTDWLKDRAIPALLFCRGDFMSNNLDPIINAINKGFVIGNHLYSHQRSSELTFEQIIEEIDKTEELINKAYKHASKIRKGKYIRFPHMDRGTAGWVIDYETVPDIYQDFVKDLFQDGIRINLDPPSDEQINKKDKVDHWLRNNGFTNPTSGINFAWYECSQMSETIDVMYTFSTCDWMLTDRHLGTKKYKSLMQLRKKIDDDLTLKETKSRHIILMHDDRENILDITQNLIDYIKSDDVEFIPIEKIES